MRKTIIATAAMALAMTATSAMAQNNVTQVTLNANVPVNINLGTLTILGSVVPTGSAGVFTAILTPNSAGKFGDNNSNFNWENSTINVPHRLKVESANGGLTNPASVIGDFRNKIAYTTYFGWFEGAAFTTANSAIINLLTAPTQLSDEYDVNTNKSGTILFGFYVEEPENAKYLPGAYTDVLTATISPIS